MANKTFIKWGDTTQPPNTVPANSVPIQWGDNPFLWEDVAVVLELVEAVGGGIAVEEYIEDLDERRRKRFITLIAKVKSKKYKETKEVNLDAKIKMKDVKLVVKEVVGIDLDVIVENNNV